MHRKVEVRGREGRGDTTVIDPTAYVKLIYIKTVQWEKEGLVDDRTA
jgi:hypothetical protein